MKLISTRDGGVRLSCAEAIVRGISAEGGLFVPESFPRVMPEELSGLAAMDYRGRAKAILGKFLTDFSPEELSGCVDGAYTAERFGSDLIAPTRLLSDDLGVLELFRGPTSAFKDMALQILPRLLTVSLKKTGETRTVIILTATSGDTGKAALEGFRDVPGTRILVFYPAAGVSNIQRLQMVTQRGDNAAVCGIDGNFDDAQRGVKTLFGDRELTERLTGRGAMLSSANSINFGRLVPQVVYYFSAYLDMVSAGAIKLGEELNFAVPTGNFGNILAAYYARRMGLPVGRLICASNRNRVLTDFIDSGIYESRRPFYVTSSPSMDILISSNLERLLFELTGRDAGEVASLMEELKRMGRYEIPKAALSGMRDFLWGGCADEHETVSSIKRVYAKYNYVCDPHTAVAFGAARRYREETWDRRKLVVAATASPMKFCGSVLRALGVKGELGDDFNQLRLLSERFGIEIPAGIGELGDLPVRFEGVCGRDGLEAELMKLV